MKNVICYVVRIYFRVKLIVVFQKQSKKKSNNCFAIEKLFRFIISCYIKRLFDVKTLIRNQRNKMFDVDVQRTSNFTILSFRVILIDYLM